MNDVFGYRCPNCKNVMSLKSLELLGNYKVAVHYECKCGNKETRYGEIEPPKTGR